MKRKRKGTKILAVVLAAGITVTAMSASAVTAGAVSGDVDYTIISTYEDVNWDTWGQYKASIHNHTTASDGTNDFREQIYNYYERDYDFLAITDHNTIDYSWTKVNVVPIIKGFCSLKRKNFDLPTMLTEQEYQDITNGVGRNGKGMLRIPNGVELNLLGLTNHVNAWFTDFGNVPQGVYGDYETTVQRVQESGGICIINHPGEYTGAKKDNSGGVDTYGDGKYANKFANVLLKYDACLGIDFNSKGDGRTKNDRYLFDQVLQRTIPNGKVPYCFASSDAHAISAVDTGWTVMCMPEKTVDEFRTCMENGTFFAGSHHIENARELAEIGGAIGEDLGAEWEADETAAEPSVKAIKVDDGEDTITIQAQDYKLIRWIADGKVIATGASIDLDDYSDKIGSYVRAEIFGDGGILYTQAFALQYDGAPEAFDIPEVYDGSRVLRFIGDTVYKLLSLIPGASIIYNMACGGWVNNFGNK